ncbi:exonuclease SbcC [Microbacterium sp. AISO3]|uniref:putative immunity protein n=1 Tax=Microbacterium sp. AISO3 TaxID=2002831 RepID=UPI000B4D7623|nr:exonuclease SbcC [Microbacterium sp. AISO3]OWP20416.1 exonuclease SbcC [Microbacterium sp. AISO3]OWP23711.1 exonuclease SbcC [Microbacterium sp. AISO3]
MAVGDFDLTVDELRAVVGFAAACATRVLPEFAAAAPDDSRPQEALDAAHVFIAGSPRSNLQRVSAFAAHRAAKEVEGEAAQLAALACGDAAAYLHPIATATQVGHILRAAACAARVSELRTGAADIGSLAGVVSEPVPAILRRYPAAPSGSSRLSRLMAELDVAIRGQA